VTPEHWPPGVRPDRSLTKPCPRCGKKGCDCGGQKDAEMVVERLDGSGRPLDPAVRERAERAFDRPLPPVRFHHGGVADDVAGSMGSLAFSAGEHIGFASSTPPPGTLGGDAILAHELAHRLQYDGRGPSRAGDRHGAERDADRTALAAGSRLLGGGRGSPVAPGGRTGLALRGCDPPTVKPAEGLAPALPAGKPYDIHTVDEYIKLWERQQGRKMTKKEKETLRAGCIGITAVNLGIGKNPPLDECFDTFAQAEKRRDELQAAKGGHFQLFSKRFYTGGKSYPAQPGTGRVDMSAYDYKAKPGWVNFDYGWYDEDTGNYWHANEGGPSMEVYQSTPTEFAKPYGGFDRQVFCVGEL
jgi:hypothetical protein